MKARRQAIALLGAAILLLAAPGCGSLAGAKPTLAAVSKGEGGGEAGGVESALVTHSDSKLGFSIGRPANWSQDTGFATGVKYAGGDDSMTLEFATLAAGSTAMVYAQKDVAAVSASYAGFKQVSLAASTEVEGAIVLGFEADGTSAVTGKTFRARDERYYMPLSGGRLAILTVTGPSNRYDREGVRDIALTFKTTN
jgi:hypothetical protein